MTAIRDFGDFGPGLTPRVREQLERLAREVERLSDVTAAYPLVVQRLSTGIHLRWAGCTGPGSESGASGAVGGWTQLYEYSADYGGEAGKIAFDSTTPSAVTEALVWKSDRNGVSQTAIYEHLKAGDWIKFFAEADWEHRYAFYQITSVNTDGDYVVLGLDYLSGSGDGFVDGENLDFGLVLAGSPGSPGSTGSQGPSGPPGPFWSLEVTDGTTTVSTTTEIVFDGNAFAVTQTATEQATITFKGVTSDTGDIADVDWTTESAGILSKVARADHVHKMEKASGLTGVTPSNDDLVPIGDVSDSTNWKRCTVGELVNAGALTEASQSDMEAASSSGVYVSPRRVQYHPGVAKAFAALFWSGGTPTTNIAHNVSGYTDNGAGDVTITWSVTFSSNFRCYAVAGADTARVTVQHDITGRSATAGRFYAFRWTAGGSLGTLADIDELHVAAFGDL